MTDLLTSHSNTGKCASTYHYICYKILCRKSVAYIRYVSITIGACCVLHNFCIMRGDHFDRQSWAGDQQVLDDGDGGIDVDPAADRNSVVVRNAIASLFGNL